MIQRWRGGGGGFANPVPLCQGESDKVLPLQNQFPGKVSGSRPPLPASGSVQVFD